MLIVLIKEKKLYEYFTWKTKETYNLAIAKKRKFEKKKWNLWL